MNAFSPCLITNDAFESGTVTKVIWTNYCRIKSHVYGIN